jgi:aminoglycoside 2'-N-acetyltransferase I
MTASTINLRVINSQDLSRQEYTEILALCSRAYERDYEPFMITFHDATHVLGYYDNILVSHALWITRWLQSADLPALQTAYVEAVATEEEYRNRGFASEVMKRLAGEITGYDLGALCTGSPDFYARLGWQVWQGPLFIHTSEGPVSTPSEIVMVLFLPNSPALDLDSSLSAEWREGELW